MTESLDGYWQGEFVLREPVAEDAQAAPAAPVERLALPAITVRGRNLATLLAAAYRAMSS